jgi:hypothetical protein
MAGTDQVTAVRVPVGDSLRERVKRITGALGDAILQALGTELPSNAREFAELERRLIAVGTSAVTGPVVQAVLRELNGNREYMRFVIEAAREKRPLLMAGHRDVAVAVGQGAVAVLETLYALPPRPRSGPRRKPGQRGPSGQGCYPLLVSLGFLGRTSPLMTSTVARAAAELGSYAEARDSLAARGIDLDFKGVRTLAHRVADACLEARRARENAPATLTLKNKRVVVTFDGGRVRTRVDKRGRLREETGRHGYHAPWREPVLVAIYQVDEKGKKTKDRPWYEGTLQGWDAAFGLAVDLLRQLGVRHARELVIAGDGAAAIWDRVDDLIGAIGIRKERVRLFADFWHAVQHLHAVAELMCSWTAEEKARWIRVRRRELFEGRIDDLVAAIREHATGRNAKKIAKEADYFWSREHLMRYAELRAAGLPIGTGAVESAIRRVVNLRMKGAGVFWKDANAERMLLLRCRLKAGRWDDLENDVYAQAGALQAGAAELAREREAS